MPEEKKENYIPLSEATKHCDHSQAYLNLRVRQGKLKAVKFGRNWMTKKEWVENYVARMNNKNGHGDYIPLGEATKHCDYSQAYLNLRVRQGKLKAVKFGRNWMTKKEWVEDYVKKARRYKKKMAAKKRASEKPALNEVPFGAFDVFAPSKLISSAFQRRRKRIGVACVLAFISFLFLTLSIFGTAGDKSYPDRVLGKASVLVGNVGEVGNDFWELSISTVQEFAGASKKDPQGIFSGYINWVCSRVSDLGREIRNIPTRIASLFFPEEEPKEKKEIAKKPLPGPEEGMVVLPSAKEDEEAKDRITASFSDEVEVKPEDKTSGIIIPVFRKGLGEEYMYVMVPTKEKKK